MSLPFSPHNDTPGWVYDTTAPPEPPLNNTSSDWNQNDLLQGVKPGPTFAATDLTPNFLFDTSYLYSQLPREQQRVQTQLRSLVPHHQTLSTLDPTTTTTTTTTPPPQTIPTNLIHPTNSDAWNHLQPFQDLQGAQQQQPHFPTQDVARRPVAQSLNIPLDGYQHIYRTSQSIDFPLQRQLDGTSFTPHNGNFKQLNSFSSTPQTSTAQYTLPSQSILPSQSPSHPRSSKPATATPRSRRRPALREPPKPRRTRDEKKCPYSGCPFPGGCQSDVNKHVHQKHTRPHKCPDCPLSFGSQADLGRHQNSAHHRDGEGDEFKCFHDDCLTSTKLYFRKDNLTQHLKKCHRSETEDIGRLVQESVKWSELKASRKDYSEYGSMPDGCSIDHPSEALRQINPGGQLQTPALPNANPDKTGELALALKIDHGERGPAQINEVADITAVTSDAAVLKRIAGMPKHELSQPVEDAIKTLINVFGKTRKSSPSSERIPGSLECKYEDCTNRYWTRERDLRKHLKRHEKPYGCTFANCYSYFGSKSDWQRHENLSHPQLQRWRCQEKDLSDPQLECAQLFERAEAFRKHLNDVHKVYNDQTIKLCIHNNRIGGNCTFQFWCGFCRTLIRLTKNSLDSRKERFNHIDNHKMDAADWWLPDQNIKKRDAKRRAQERSKDDQTVSTIPDSTPTPSRSLQIGQFKRPNRQEYSLRSGQRSTNTPSLSPLLQALPRALIRKRSSSPPKPQKRQCQPDLADIGVPGSTTQGCLVQMPRAGKASAPRPRLRGKSDRKKTKDNAEDVLFDDFLTYPDLSTTSNSPSGNSPSGDTAWLSQQIILPVPP
ncbi:hypothetical protein FQN57_006944 [Myotisia sp. PD_48]|nr:hypothetical protein FQN57_006944 [Myotisia sp. PD_48]